MPCEVHRELKPMYRQVAPLTGCDTNDPRSLLSPLGPKKVKRVRLHTSQVSTPKLPPISQAQPAALFQRCSRLCRKRGALFVDPGQVRTFSLVVTRFPTGRHLNLDRLENRGVSCPLSGGGEVPAIHTPTSSLCAGLFFRGFMCIIRLMVGSRRCYC